MARGVTGVRVVIGDPRHQQEDLAGLLREHHDVGVVMSADDAASLLLQAERVTANVVVLTTEMFSFLPDACDRLPSLAPGCRILLLDAVPDEESLLRAIEAGVDGYITRRGGVASVTQAVLTVARGESVIPPAMLGPLLRRLIQRRRDADQAADRLVHLTPREREVLALLVDGLDQGEIAAALFISPETARTHLQRVLRKLDVHSRSEAVELVSRTGMADRLERLVERTAS